jgi:hypothetical protein
MNVELFIGDRSALVGRLNGPAHAWNHTELPLVQAPAAEAAPAPAAALGLNTSGVQGSGAVIVHAARALDGHLRETQSLVHGQPMTLELDYELKDPQFSERPQVVIALQRDGVVDVCRWIARDLQLDAATARRGTIRLHVPRLLLTDGQYSVTILIAKEGYYDRSQTMFYSINPEVYFVASRLFDIVIRGSGLIGSGTTSVAYGEWEASQ